MKKKETEKYSKYWMVEAITGLLALATCQRCGACVILNNPKTDGMKIHDDWHENK